MRSSVLNLADLGRVADANETGAEDVAIERSAPAELPVDLLEDGDVLLERVGVEGRHHAAAADLPDAEQRVAELDLPPDPVALGQARNAGQVDVRAETAAVDADRGDASVGRERDRQHVEALRAAAVVADELGVGLGHAADGRERRRVAPRHSIDRRLAVGIEPALEPEHPRNACAR